MLLLGGILVMGRHLSLMGISRLTIRLMARLAGDADDESCWLVWSIWTAVLAGITRICTSALAAFGRANRLDVTALSRT